MATCNITKWFPNWFLDRVIKMKGKFVEVPVGSCSLQTEDGPKAPAVQPAAPSAMPTALVGPVRKCGSSSNNYCVGASLASAIHYWGDVEGAKVVGNKECAEAAWRSGTKRTQTHGGLLRL